MSQIDGALGPADSPPGTSSGVLSIREVTKRFGPTVALKGVSFDLRPGEVVALLGENGAGKSTLCNILDGVTDPSEGHLTIGGAPYQPSSPSDAQRAGIGIVHQELQVLPELSVAENLFLGGEAPTRLGMISKARLGQEATAALRTLGLDKQVSPWTRVGLLSVASQQLVSIAKVLHQQGRFLIFDEPTASISDEESHVLFDRIAEVRNRGVAVLYITHRLAEVRDIADRALILRDGRLIAEHDAASTPVRVIVRDMVGRSIENVFPDKPPFPAAAPILQVRGLSQTGAFEDVDFDVRPGEVFGIAGLVGSGRSEILHAIAGMTRPNSGSMVVDGDVVRWRGVNDAIHHGLVLSPEDRKSQGLLLDQSIEDNLGLPILSRLLRLGFLSRRRLRREARALVEQFDVRGGGLQSRVQDLSGGNQQKVLLGRCLATRPRVLLLDEPTRGVDVGARSTIYEHLMSLACEGMAVVMVSSELEELTGLCHRIGVVRTDRTFGGVVDGSATHEEIMNVVTAQASDP